MIRLRYPRRSHELQAKSHARKSDGSRPPVQKSRIRNDSGPARRRLGSTLQILSTSESLSICRKIFEAERSSGAGIYRRREKVGSSSRPATGFEKRGAFGFLRQSHRVDTD